MLMGQYHQKIDEKGRLTIPAKFRSELGEEFVVSRGLDGCLFIYSKEEWDKMIKKYETLPNVKDARNFMRFLLSGASDEKFDKNGRINVTSPLLKYANLKKECVVIGVGDRLEVWDEEDWDKFTLENEDSFSQIADKLFSEKID